MYSARLIKTGVSDEPGSDRPVVRWPRPQIHQFTLGERTVLQLKVPADALAGLENVRGDIEVQLVAAED